MIADRPTVQDMLQGIRRLTTQEQLDLIAEITALVRNALPPRPKQSILELEGLGARIWQGLSAQEYVTRERDAWDG